ncbi:signal peptidase I [Stratiformator vulcanicus]|uniref:Signal peptidase I n=1 Tax=Stratiformator vulcanicus TaxID=2527980 RepID=A0A517QW39_9PLAN|nr:signal peptidase I [Stratiformator vulcanicus]QDT35885.1 Signal peptidase I [Stratiformator vulcanicus]
MAKAAARTKSKGEKTPSATPAQKKAKQKKSRSKDGTRDTIESIVIAFIFAFLVRTFEAEAFVIPTGSMAETLFGRHKDIECPECDFHFEIGASEEFGRNQFEGVVIAPKRIQTATCPNCRYEFDVKSNPAFRGDRIIVNKFTYEVGNPDRWDVVVFKYPEDPETNYIKRLVGLPGETLEIKQGDLYRIGEDGRAEILRKQAYAKEQAMRFVVYDNNLPASALSEAGYPERWFPAAKDGAPGNVAGWSLDAVGWDADYESRTFALSGDAATGDKPRWLRYRHLPPTERDWERVLAGEQPDPQASLILDFCGYNAWSSRINQIDNQRYWVGDLAVSASFDIAAIGENPEVLIELVEGERRYRCRIDPSTGLARLSFLDALSAGDDPDDEMMLAEADTWLKGEGAYDVVFSNTDDRLRLLINGSEVKFGAAAEYQPYGALEVQLPTGNDLAPVGIAARGVDLTVGDLKIDRDIYYRGEYLNPLFERFEQAGDFFLESAVPDEVLNDAVTDPERWGRLYLDNLLALAQAVPPEVYRYELGPDEFLMLGDNSQRSKDSRLWSNVRGATHRYAVHRSALVGKAFFFLWPHGLPIGNETEDGVPQGWAIPGLEGFCYHKVVKRGPDGRDYVTIDEDYQQFGVPFIPNFARIFRPIR